MADVSTLKAISPIDGRYAHQVNALTPICSEFGLMHFRIKAEITWFEMLAACSEIHELPSLNRETLQFLQNIISTFDTTDAKTIKTIEKQTNHDVKAIEYFLKKQFAKHELLKNYQEFIHFACTSEDINNVAYALMLKELREAHLLPLMRSISGKLKSMAKKYAAEAMLSHTHGQAASPTTMGKELANFVYRLNRQIEYFQNAPILAKMNGAVGNYNAHITSFKHIDWIKLSQKFIKKLSLENNPYTTQIEPHDYLAHICQILNLFNVILIDLCRDIWGYISLGYFKQAQKSDEIGSSTMPHKINPIDFENAEGNLGIANALLEHFANKLPISRWQRDLSDSTVLRNLGTVFAHMSIAYQSILKGLDKLDTQPKLMQEILNKHWEILAEPIQVIMRRYGIDEPYEKLKVFTRGKAITADDMQHFLSNLDLPNEAKSELLALTPDNYLGLAEKLAKQV